MTVESARPHQSNTLTLFRQVKDWVFDLDNTLYPEHTNLFDQISTKITHFVVDHLNMEKSAAHDLQMDYYQRYGTTLRGLMLEHDVDPDLFLEFVHDIDHSPVEANLPLAETIKALPGRKFIYTNGSRKHAEKVATQLGITDHFEDIFDIVAADLVPKPDPQPYQKFFTTTGINPTHAAMFEDLVKNLEVPKVHGMITTLIVPRGTREAFIDWEHHPACSDAKPSSPIDFVTDDLTCFLQQIAHAI